MLIRTLLLALAIAPSLHGGTLFRKSRVFDGTKLLPAGTEVLVENGTIAAVGVGLTARPETEVIDAAGKTLLPGFIDAHTHVFGDALADALMFGVTTELDQFTAHAMAKTLRAEQAAGNVATRADLFSAGTLVTAPGGHGTEYGMPIPTISKPEEAQAFVDARIAEGSDWIKIVYDDGHPYGMNMPTVDEPTMRAVIAAAHARGKLAVVHIGALKAARAAIAAGADGLVHLFVDRDPDPELGAFAAKHEVFVIPTMTVLKSITGVAGAGTLLEDKRLMPYLTAGARNNLAKGFPRSPDQPAVSYAASEATVRQLLKHGVPVLAGTDAPNPGTAHCAAMHREIELLVMAGMTPVQALTAATSAPAKAFRIEDRGRIAPGQRADLLLVEGDPTADITATRAITGIWKGGVAVDRAPYAKAIAAAAEFKIPVPKGIESETISGFEDGALSAAYGTWMPTADSMAGGKSSGEVKVVDGGAAGSSKSLSITGTIDGALPYAWYGALWSPGAPMQPADVSSKKELRFRARGDGKTYRVMIFAQSKGMMPSIETFIAGPEWTEVVMPLSAFETDGKDMLGIIFAGGPAPGPFAFAIDDVAMR